MTNVEKEFDPRVHPEHQVEGLELLLTEDQYHHCLDAGTGWDEILRKCKVVLYDEDTMEVYRWEMKPTR